MARTRVIPVYAWFLVWEDFLCHREAFRRITTGRFNCIEGEWTAPGRVPFHCRVAFGVVAFCFRSQWRIQHSSTTASRR
ncbi:MAG: hypothetical protein JWQ56_275 [Pseudarthrobacter sp.]|nr:hypothetical protein [Pseudarthrobacter sp.]